MAEARFTIVGAGAIGMLFAAKLGLSGRPVEICVRRPSHKAELLSSGIRLSSAFGETASNEASGGAGETAFFPKIRLLGEAHPDRSDEEGLHFIVLAVKQSAFTADFVRCVHGLMGPQSWVVCLQNGLGHIEALSSVIPAERIIAAVTTEGAMKSSDVAAVHTGRGETRIGAIAEGPAPVAEEAQKKLAELFEQAGFRTYVSKNITRRVWQKLTINSIINPLTAILHVRNGELPEQPHALKLMRALFVEATELSGKLGQSPDPELWDQLLEVCRRTSGNRSSMLQDLLAGRPTEIDSITGGMLKEAEKLRMPLPAHETVYRLVKAMEGAASGKSRTPSL